MAGFLYFLPGRENEQVSTVAQAAALGIGYSFESDRRVEKRRVTGAGPSGGPGLLVFDGAAVPAAQGRVDLKAQAWRQFTPLMPGGQVANVWVGYITDSPPRWSELRRAQLISGREVQTDDGQQILIPTARQFELNDQGAGICYSCNLPRMLDVDHVGELVPGDIVARHRRLWQVALDYDGVAAKALGEAIDATDGGEVVVRFDFPRMNEFIHEALVTNHRAGLQELLLLRQYDVAFRQRVIDVVLDNDTWSQLQKKILDQLAARWSMDFSNGPGPSSPAAGIPSPAAIVPASASGEPLPPDATGQIPSWCTPHDMT